MKNLQFWEDKYTKSFQKFMHHRGMYIFFKMNIDHEKNQRLKKIYGHGMNKEYTGYKIHKRREMWLKRRLSYLTNMAKHRKEMLRVVTTKLSFFEKKIYHLGGNIINNWRDYLIKDL